MVLISDGNKLCINIYLPYKAGCTLIQIIKNEKREKLKTE